jgi:hypothetical protein
MSNSKNLSLDKKNIDTVLVLDFGSQYTQLIAKHKRKFIGSISKPFSDA